MSKWQNRLPELTSVWQELIELTVPIEAFAARFSRSEGTVLLLSGSDLDCSKYHILGLDPWLTLKGRGDRLTLTVQGESIPIAADPFDVLSALTAHFRLPEQEPDLPLAAGLMGYFGYDLKDRIENLPITCVDTGLPDICLYAPSVILVQERETGGTTLNIPIIGDGGLSGPAPEVYVRRVKETLLAQAQADTGDAGFSIDPRGLVSGFEKHEYLEAVRKIIRYLRAGDIYQANLAQRFETGFSGDPYTLFQKLFSRNPAPFFSYIQAGDHQIVSTSPERFIQQAGRQVETRPIKGTIARGKSPEQDRENGRTLENSIKDDAELTMIVDLMRNDLSRVTEHGSVVVTEHKRIEPYQNVFHLVSIVHGTLSPGKTGVDLLKATFPGGSITGCPKIRSMEIIDELEPVKRHVYTGSIGYLSFHDTMDLSIAIRTATVTGGRIFFSVGGGIVYDSDPEKEFQETLDKGQTLMETLIRESDGRMARAPKAWVAGKLVDQDRATAPLTGPGFQYGAGIFETIRVEQGVPVRLDAHIARMTRSWQALFGSELPDMSWDRVVDQLIRENRLADQTAAVKLMASRDAGETGSPAFLAAVARPYVHRLKILDKPGLDLVTYPHARQTPLAGHKSMNYLYYLKAGEFARENGGDEALILNPDGTVSETNTCNLLILDDSRVIIPASSHVLPGVSQAAVLAALEKEGMSVETQSIHQDSLAGYANILVTNALMGAVRVDRVDGKAIRHDEGVCDSVNRLLA